MREEERRARDMLAFWLIVGLIIIAFCSILGVIILAIMEKEVPDILVGVIGAFVGYGGSIVQHYFGHSR